MNVVITKESSVRYILSTDKDSHFTEAIAQYATEEEDLPGLASNFIIIREVTILSDQNLSYRLLFFTTDGFANANLDLDTFLSSRALDIPTSGFQIGATGKYYLEVDNLAISYHDDDGTHELHVALQNLSATGKNAGATGEVVVHILYELVQDVVKVISGGASTPHG